MPTLRLTRSMTKSIARQNRAGAKTHPCLTPEVVVNGSERQPARRTLADVAVFKSTNATCNGCWNSPWISVNRRNAKIASSVERQRVNPDW